MLFEKRGGRWKYPAIQKDWKEDTRTCYLLISDRNFNSFKENIKTKSSFNIQGTYGLVSNRHGEPEYSKSVLMISIERSLKEYFGRLLATHPFKGNYQLIDGKEYIRFLLPEMLGFDKGSRFSETSLDESYF